MKKRGYNLGALVTGRQLKRLTVGALPPKLRRAQERGYSLRRDLEAEVVAQHGEISLTRAAVIDAASGDETCLGVVSWLLLHNLDELTPDQLLQCLTAMSRFRHSRNRQIDLLQLDFEKDSSILALYSDPPASSLASADTSPSPTPPSPLETPQTASCERTEDTTSTPSPAIDVDVIDVSPTFDNEPSPPVDKGFAT